MRETRIPATITSHVGTGAPPVQAERRSRRALYIGMTNNLHRRVLQHKTQEFEGFSDDYDTVRLVYWESSDDVHKTIAREKQLKNWRREKKLWLIASMNPKFKDLAADWYEKQNLDARRA